MINPIYYKSNLSTTEDSSRGPSANIWGDCPVLEIIRNPGTGVHFFDDFLATPDVAAGAEAVYGIYKGFASTGGSVAEGTSIFGEKTLSSDGDNEGASLATVSKPFKIARGQGRFWFEARVKTSSISDTLHGMFVGLIDTSTLSATVPIAAAGTLADENFVGFHKLEGDGDMLDTVYKTDGNSQGTLQADAITLVADTYVKVGMVFDPNTYVLTFFKNGVPLSTTYTVTATAGNPFPNDVNLGLVVAVLNATGTTPGSSSIDWWRAAQLTA